VVVWPLLRHQGLKSPLDELMTLQVVYGEWFGCASPSFEVARRKGALDLNKLFIEPRHMRSGVGRALLAHAIAEARRRGAGRLTILANPNAADFYERYAQCGSARHPRRPSSWR
jgi:GNAT superfamily N-acetyltransferase